MILRKIQQNPHPAGKFSGTAAGLLKLKKFRYKG